MNGITIIIWIIIAVIGIVASIMVKKQYKGDKLAKDEEPILNGAQPKESIHDTGKNFLSRNNNNSKSTHSQPNKSNPHDFENNASFNDVNEGPIVYEVENYKNNNSYRNVEYESQNQVLIDYGNTVEKFQEPIKQSQMDIMTRNNNTNKEKHELKDLFTIDELIKESKRKDSEREKETHNADDEEEINELKESIKQRQENKIDDALIEEIITNEEETINQLINETSTEEPKTEETINDIITEKTEDPKTEETINDLIGSESDAKEKTESEESETPIVTSQDIEEAINTASQEVKEEPKSISESAGITDVLLDNVENEVPKEEIKEPMLKTPTKVDENNTTGEYDSDLDYRKDLAKITNTIKGSKIFKDVKERLTPDEPEVNHIEEDFIRNVNEYEDNFAPIINETHIDFEATYDEYHKEDFDDGLRQKNTEKVFSIIKDTPEKPEESKIPSIKEKPSRDNIKIQINNNEVVLKKGDEIIFNHLGESYSSQVYAINGDDISVRYRRQNIIIKPSDVKKVY
ncbi:hypothetical protein [Methanobrevibacter sp.]|uniref:hypothetical protein n=1 Tax=Methanobrevibacter sp. TaxID=66852 RepID=UPI00388DFB57